MILRGRRTRGMRRFDRWSPEFLAGVRPQFHRLRRPVMGLGPFHCPGADDLRMTSFVHTFLLPSIVYTPHKPISAPPQRSLFFGRLVTAMLLRITTAQFL